MTSSLTRRSTAAAIALALGTVGFAAPGHAGGLQAEATAEAGSLAPVVTAVQAADVVEDIPGAEDMPVDRGIALPPVHPMNAEMTVGDLGAVFDAKALRQVSDSAPEIGSEAGQLQ